jgi:hypothetical protein
VVAFAGGLLGGVSAFGTGLLITPFVVPILGVKAVVPVMSVAMVLGNLARAGANWRDVDLGLCARILLPATPFVVLGTLVYDALPAAVLGAVIGAFLVASVPLRRALKHKAVAPGRFGLAAMAAGFGFVSGTVPGGGILLMPILLGLGYRGGAIIGIDGLLGASINVVKIASFGQLALLDAGLATAGLLIGLLTIPGAFTARWIVTRLDVGVHTGIVEAMVVAAGCLLVVGVI